MKTLKQQEYEMNMDALSKITDWHRTTQHITGSYSITTIELEREIREAERQLWFLEQKAAKRDRWSMNCESRVKKT